MNNITSKWSGGVLGSARLTVPSLAITDNAGQPYLPLAYNFPYGTTNNVDPESALVRPFKKLLRDGKPIGKVNFVFFKEKNNFFTLGSFANTGKRLIFFPAVIPKILVEAPDDAQFIKTHKVTLDPLSLEESWRTWHLTFLEKETHGYRIKTKNTKKLNDDVFLWFVMAIKSLDKIESMPTSQEIRLTWPNANELKRRVKEITGAISGSIFNVTMLEEYPFVEHYLNFEFFLSSKPHNFTPEIETIYTAKHLSSERPSTIEHTRIHPMMLNQFNGTVWIRVSKVPGQLNQDRLFIPGKDYL